MHTGMLRKHKEPLKLPHGYDWYLPNTAPSIVMVANALWNYDIGAYTALLCAAHIFRVLIVLLLNTRWLLCLAFLHPLSAPSKSISTLPSHLFPTVSLMFTSLFIVCLIHTGGITKCMSIDVYTRLPIHRRLQRVSDTAIMLWKHQPRVQ